MVCHPRSPGSDRRRRSFRSFWKYSGNKPSVGHWFGSTFCTVISAHDTFYSRHRYHAPSGIRRALAPGCLFGSDSGVALGCAMGSLQRLVILEDPQLAAFFAGLLLVSACTVAFLLPVLFSAVTDGLGIPSAAFMILFGLLTACLWLFMKARREHERRSLLQRGVSTTYHQ